MAIDGDTAFAQLADQYARAAQQAGEVVRTYALAGHRLRVRHAGPRVAAVLGRAMAHLQVPPGSADVTISAWDSASSGTTMPPPPWSLDALGRARGEIAAGRLRAAFHIDAGILSLFDPERGQALWWTRDAEALPGYERAAPLRTILHFWAAARKLHLVHGAAVGTREAAVLITAPGGSGKSTTALSCLLDGLGYLGDDYTLVGLDPPSAHLVYGSAKLDACESDRFAALRPCLDDDRRVPGEKLIYHLNEHHPEKLVFSAPLRHLLVPRFADRDETRIAPARASSCLLALGPSTIFQQPGAGTLSMRFLAELVRRVPGHRLELGRDRAAVPRAIRSLLGRS